ncbi:uncharacterized protein BXZ73DRAFT_99560 [Epithele typhae]|uniref:uncharacterized protein n=1 Tax=Epithele typhae TaxID=378194 RepID=UPI002008BACF|nr:uncharacterized protein BXZ73DRAFT_99560 [Epithele typhae]KAH9939357.1 hypothetical protein BXZ73DRAFT_99560 [Epithele typhae]
MPPSDASSLIPSFRTFSSFRVHGGRPVAIGRNHDSWFLVFPKPDGMRLRRAARIINYTPPSDHNAVGATTDRGFPAFVIGGATGAAVLDALLALRSDGGLPFLVLNALKTTRLRPEDHVGVEVGLRPEEIAHACARCGKWELEGRHRWFSCTACHKRYYCGSECQRVDWEEHAAECEFLQKGDHFAVQRFRKTHDNGWWFDHGALGDATMLIGDGSDELDRAMEAGDQDFLTYGRCDPLRNRRPVDRSQLPAGVAEVPPLPKVPGFVATGDPALDEVALGHYADAYCTSSTRQMVMDVIDARQRALASRQKMIEDEAREVQQQH